MHYIDPDICTTRKNTTRIIVKEILGRPIRRGEKIHVVTPVKDNSTVPAISTSAYR